MVQKYMVTKKKKIEELTQKPFWGQQEGWGL